MFRRDDSSRLCSYVRRPQWHPGALGVVAALALGCRRASPAPSASDAIAITHSALDVRAPVEPRRSPPAIDATITDAQLDDADADAPEAAVDPTATFLPLGSTLTIEPTTPAAPTLLSGTIDSPSHLDLGVDPSELNCRGTPESLPENGRSSQTVTLDVARGVDHVRVWLFSEDNVGLFVTKPDRSVECEYSQPRRSAVVDLSQPEPGRYRVRMTGLVTESVALLGVARDPRARPWTGRMPTPPSLPNEVRAQWEVLGSDQLKQLTLVLQGAMQRRIAVTAELNGECRPARNVGANLLTMGCSPSVGDQEESPLSLRPSGPRRFVIDNPDARGRSFEIPAGTRLVEHPQRRAVHLR